MIGFIAAVLAFLVIVFAAVSIKVGRAPVGDTLASAMITEVLIFLLYDALQYI